jgi:hypothetical protein
MNGRYARDTDTDVWYHYDNPDLSVYKKGAENFINSIGNIDNLISKKLCNTL